MDITHIYLTKYILPSVVQEIHYQCLKPYYKKLNLYSATVYANDINNNEQN